MLHSHNQIAAPLVVWMVLFLAVSLKENVTMEAPAGADQAGQQGGAELGGSVGNKALGVYLLKCRSTAKMLVGCTFKTPLNPYLYSANFSGCKRYESGNYLLKC